MIKALYVHIPFSSHICGVSNDTFLKYDFFLRKKYIERLITQISDMKEKPSIVYIGSGSITRLEPELIEKLLASFTDWKLKEFSIECNPHDLKDEHIQLFKKYSVNRIVLGVQKEKHLKLDDYYEFNEAVNTLKKYRFENIALDIPMALADQSLDHFETLLKQVLTLDPSHLTLYGEGDDPAFYETAKRLIKKTPLKQYETANFAKEDSISQYNRIFFDYDDYYAVGVGSNYMVNQTRYTWTDDLEIYLKEDVYQDVEYLSEAESMFEHIMMGLSLRDGISLSDFEKKHQKKLLDVYQEAITASIAYLEITPTHIKLKYDREEMLDTVLLNFME